MYVCAYVRTEAERNTIMWNRSRVGTAKSVLRHVQIFVSGSIDEQCSLIYEHSGKNYT
jgi:hypothetical protein